MFLLLLTAGLATFLLPCGAEDFYVRPSLDASENCPQPCHTLDQYATNASLFGNHTNISLIFLSGEHSLNFVLSITGVSELVLQGREPSASLDDISVVIDLKQPQSMITVSDVVSFKMYNIKIQSIFPPIHYPAKLSVSNVQNITQYHMVMKNISPRMVFTAARYTMTRSNITINECNYTNCPLDIKYGHTMITLNIENSAIEDCHFGIHFSSFPLSVLTIRNVQFNRNAFGLVVRTPNPVVRVEIYMYITDTEFKDGQAGVYVDNYFGPTDFSLENSNISRNTKFGLLLATVHNATITNSHIQDNYIGLVSASSSVLLQTTSITKNTFGVAAIDISLPLQLNVNIYRLRYLTETRDCNFTMNNLAALAIIGYQNEAIVRDCSFKDNRGTPIIVYQSTFELTGQTIFEDNHADRGGGLSLYNSTVIFGQNSNTTFKDNRAREYGGALYITSLPTVLPEIVIGAEILNNIEGPVADLLNTLPSITNNLFNQNCFYKYEDASQVSFIGNSAMLGGVDIYGATLYTDDCSISNNIFNFDETVPSTLRVSSDPTRVCFCDNGTPQCKDKSLLVLNETKYPGERFTVSLALAGYNFGLVAGSVHTNILGKDNMGILGETYEVEKIRYMRCCPVMYTITSNQTSSSVILVLTSEQRSTAEDSESDIQMKRRIIYSPACNRERPCTALLTTPVYIMSH